MKKFWIVFKHEFLNQVKSKAYIGITVLMLVLIFGGTLFAKNKYEKSQLAGSNPEEISDTVHVVVDRPELKTYIDNISTYGYEVVYYDNVESLKQHVEAEQDQGIHVKDYGMLEMIYYRMSMGEEFNPLNMVLNENYKNHLLIEKGLSVEDIQQINQTVLDVEINNLGKDGSTSFGIVYGFTMLLYFALILFGGIISSSVITEKTSKAMEVLITSASPTSLVAGKVMGVGSAYVVQIAIVLAGALVSVKLNLMDALSSFPVAETFQSVLEVLPFGLFMVIIGFFSYLFLFAALSSFSSRPEDANLVITPIMIIIIVVFMVMMIGMNTNLFETTAMKIISYIPLLSPFFLFARYAMYGLSTLELIFGVVINIVGAALLVMLATKIYRAGTMFYGNQLKLSTIFKQTFKNK